MGGLPSAALLKRFVASLEELSVARAHLSSLTGLPRLPTLRRLSLPDNCLLGAAALAAVAEACGAMLCHLDLGNNRFAEVQELAPLARVWVESLDLFQCPITKVKGYMEEVFVLIPSLKYLDGADAEGNERLETDSQPQRQHEWLPKGWVMEVRAGGEKADKMYKFYVHSITGLRLLSKQDVLLYINEAKISGCDTNGQCDTTSEDNILSKVDFRPSGLHEGWVKELVYRKTKEGLIRRDPYYTDPASSYTFRTLKSALSFLETGKHESLRNRLGINEKPYQEPTKSWRFVSISKHKEARCNLKEDDTPAYLINAKDPGKYIDGNGFMKLLKPALSDDLPDIKTEGSRVVELKGKYRSFLSSKFDQCLPEEFSF
ncbi:Acidic leucine-rich nuclear phosphoprotein 32-related protein 2 [Zea mays]|uniref:Acidic leucine-rich nuclear phosphoprotein 32-related protein 2 n=1 Tax=Zea mays TaxID=4577 RepID=A0A3L6DZN2_MAIZE|nr:Acidic leucine-rich nuclear phosphoprotein 32-related protein 2 [Zea mays]